MLLLLRVNFYTLQKIELLFEILETRLENQLDEVARSWVKLLVLPIPNPKSRWSLRFWTSIAWIIRKLINDKHETKLLPLLQLKRGTNHDLYELAWLRHGSVRERLSRAITAVRRQFHSSICVKTTDETADHR